MTNFFPAQSKTKTSVMIFVLLSVSLIGLAACNNVSQTTPARPAATATTAAAPTDTPAAATPTPLASQSMTETQMTTTTQSMTGTATTTATHAMTTTPRLTETQGLTETSRAAGPIVMLHEDAKLGQILVDAKGMTLYVFDNDEAGKSNCTGQCLQNWPALTVTGKDAALTAGAGVTGQLGVIERTDGTYQVTMNGMPLYYYAKDTKAGETTGQGVGDVWWVIGADGAKINTK